MAENESKEDVSHGRMKGQRVCSLLLAPKGEEYYCLVLTGVSPWEVFAGFVTGR